MVNKPQATFREAQAVVGSDMYKVLQHLQRSGVERPQTIEQIETATQVRIRDNPDLQAAMENHARMGRAPDGPPGSWVYKPEHNIRNKQQLREFLLENRFRRGVLKKELEHSFAGFEQALLELRAANEVHTITHAHHKDKEVLFYNDPSLAVHMDPTLVDMWAEIAMPNDDREIERDLERVGLKGMQAKVAAAEPTTAAAKVPKKPKGRQSRIMNTHLSADSGIVLTESAAK